MLLTITATFDSATDLGYLLHKSPGRLHSFELAFGTAHVFYPEANSSRATAALLLRAHGDIKLGDLMIRAGQRLRRRQRLERLRTVHLEPGGPRPQVDHGDRRSAHQ